MGYSYEEKAVPSQDAAAALKRKTAFVSMWAMAKNNGAEGLLMRAEEVSCANSVLNIYKYTNVIEKFLYYLMSRNLKYVNFYEQGARKAE